MDSRRTTPNPDEPRVGSQSFGSPLKAARENRGMSLDQISRLTKLRPNLLEALEASDLSKLPESIYTRAYLNNYANVLGIDPNPLLEAYDRNTVMLHAPSFSPSSAQTKAARKEISLQENNIREARINKPVAAKQRSNQTSTNFWPTVLGSLLALAVVAGGAYWFSNRSNSRPPVVVTVPAPTPTEPAATQNTVPLSVSSTPAGASVLVDRFRIGVTPMVGVPVAVGAGRELRVQLPGFEDGVKLLDIDAARNLSFVLQKKKNDATTPASTAVAGVGPKDVTLKFTGQSWVRISDMTGHLIYQGLPAVGSSQTFKTAIQIRVGNPSAVVVSIGGQERGPLGPNSTPVTTKLP